MLAAHRDQENLIHEQQTAAAVKPLNQSVRGLAPKTPGNNGNNKFFNGKIPLKSAGKGDENVVFGGKTAKANKNAFVTPVGPRERAPLGAKTTNAKATAFQTPAPLTGGQGLQKTQRPSGSARKHKLKVHQPEAVEVEPITRDDEDEVPDVEYCPPKITELPDIPDDPNAFGPGKTFPQFEGDNMFRGWYSLYCNPIGEDGLSNSQRETKKRLEEAYEWSERVLMESLEKEIRDWEGKAESVGEDNLVSTSKSKLGPTSRAPKSHLSTLNAKSAAAALSKKPQPSYAAPTAAVRAKETTALPAVTLPKRNLAASHSTIGYARGRKVSSSLKQIDNQTRDVAHASNGDGQAAKVKKEDELIKQLIQRPSEFEDDDELDFSWCQKSRDLFEEEDSRPYVLKLPDYEQ